jgi:TPR repeat protein
LKQSVLWFTKAAKNGDAYAQTALAYAYEYGNGVQKSPRTAIYWYKQAAEQKYIPAMYNLAQWYSENGKGDMRKAVEWWRKAAKGDHREAQCNLGGAYETGRGIRRSLPQAIRWYRQALKLGDKLAKNNLARIRRTGQAEDSTVWRK